MANKNTLRPWKPGQSGNPAGRPKGSRALLSEKFISALLEDFTEHGRLAMEKVRLKQPGIYLRVIASLMPRELHMKNESLFQGMSDEHLNETIESVRRILAARSPAGSTDGKQKAGGGDEPDRLH
jgi:hypothetical protein